MNFYEIVTRNVLIGLHIIVFCLRCILNLVNTKEKKQHSSIYIPYSYYHCILPDLFPFVPLHWHNEFEISFISEGNGIFRCGDQSVAAGPGDLIVILPNMLHSICQSDEKRLVYDTILFSQSMIYGTGDDRCYIECLSHCCSSDCFVRLPVTAEHPAYDELKKAVLHVIYSAKTGSGQMDLLLKSELLRIFWLLIQNHDLRSSKHNSSLAANSIRPVLSFISQNYTEPISVEQLAEMVHLSKSYFMNVFRSTTGISALEYVNQIRIQAACQLLRDTGMRSSEIAFSCGFQNLSNFNRQFRKFTEFSPVEYRKQVHSTPAFQPDTFPDPAQFS